MRGRHPKDPKLRQRRNRPPSSSAELSDATVVRKVPELPKLAKRRSWHQRTVAWWKDLWASPMAERYLTADVHGLYVAAALCERFWRAFDAGEPTATIGSELRRQVEQYGLSALSRRRLDWRIREAPEPTEKAEPAAREVAAGGGGHRKRQRPDPRAALRVLEGGKASD